jgi:hypothetical protein
MTSNVFSVNRKAVKKTYRITLNEERQSTDTSPEMMENLELLEKNFRIVVAMPQQGIYTCLR